jgi:hypothetical protein
MPSATANVCHDIHKHLHRHACIQGMHVYNICMQTICHRLEAHSQHMPYMQSEGLRFPKVCILEMVTCNTLLTLRNESRASSPCRWWPLSRLPPQVPRAFLTTATMNAYIRTASHPCLDAKRSHLAKTFHIAAVDCRPEFAPPCSEFKNMNERFPIFLP